MSLVHSGCGTLTFVMGRCHGGATREHEAEIAAAAAAVVVAVQHFVVIVILLRSAPSPKSKIGYRGNRASHKFTRKKIAVGIIHRFCGHRIRLPTGEGTLLFRVLHIQAANVAWNMYIRRRCLYSTRLLFFSHGCTAGGVDLMHQPQQQQPALEQSFGGFGSKGHPSPFDDDTSGKLYFEVYHISSIILFFVMARDLRPHTYVYPGILIHPELNYISEKKKLLHYFC